jgi:hypothetical protein
MAKPDTYLRRNKPYAPRSADIEAAKHLALVARRFANERANRSDVDDAVAIWRDTAPTSQPAGTPAAPEPEKGETNG